MNLGAHEIAQGFIYQSVSIRTGPPLEPRGDELHPEVTPSRGRSWVPTMQLALVQHFKMPRPEHFPKPGLNAIPSPRCGPGLSWLTHSRVRVL